ncbi:hypothetical protein [Sphingobium chlorophenolicum]|uniref:Uncharacterized protein n=1 Tax=Sphingobium chlorophenolicum TaxID=46429 RepID=A0A081RAC7_SPHCR|nr:hypothetical protein [Sphingobium chlorophenolicum]KEQ52150.1 hypothetical protein BV95_03567 [Sphingobium chlorophenolicum]
MMAKAPPSRSANLDLLEMSFGEFYSQTLVADIGSRLRPREIRDAYLSWALSSGGSYLSYRALVSLMDKRGHHRIFNDGAQYLNVAFQHPGSSPSTEAAKLLLTAGAAIRERDALYKAQLSAIARKLGHLIDELAAIQQAIGGGQRG